MVEVELTALFVDEPEVERPIPTHRCPVSNAPLDPVWIVRIDVPGAGVVAE
jgi:hypothetical protein